MLLLDGVFPNLSLSPCWIKVGEMSPGCTCVEHGGAVRSVIWIIGDLDHDEYDSINPVLLNASARDLQGYVDALLFPSLIDES